MKSDTSTSVQRKLITRLSAIGRAISVATSLGCQRSQGPRDGGVTRQGESAHGQQGPSEDDEARFARLAATAPTMSIEIVEPGKFKIDGNGPFGVDEARSETVRVATGKKQIIVQLTSSRENIADHEYKTFKESLHSDGGLLVGLDIAGLAETREP